MDSKKKHFPCLIERTLTLRPRTNQNPSQQQKPQTKETKNPNRNQNEMGFQVPLSPSLPKWHASQMGFPGMENPPNGNQGSPKRTGSKWPQSTRWGTSPNASRGVVTSQMLLLCFLKIIPWSRKSRVVQAGGREEHPQGKDDLGSWAAARVVPSRTTLPLSRPASEFQLPGWPMGYDWGSAFPDKGPR